MDHEFHYSMTYLVAARAGFSPQDALIIAHASQSVDDNTLVFAVDKGKPSAFSNYISQTMNILKPKKKLMRIYPVFHFLPGDPLLRSAARKDGMMHWLNCTPGSTNAQKMFDAALATVDLHRIGIAAHVFADTWAHQNFTGSYCDINGRYTKQGFDVGHAQFGHQPDEPALVWHDDRLLRGVVDNRSRFLDAAKQLFLRLLRHMEPGVSQDHAAAEAQALRNDLSHDIGPLDLENKLAAERAARFRARAATPPYGGAALPDYDAGAWFEEAVHERVRGLKDRSLELYGIDLRRWLDFWFTDLYTWKDPDRYQETNWYRFQVAVKDHQRETLEILAGTNLGRLQLPEGGYKLHGAF